MPNFEFGLENPNNYCNRNVYIFTLVHIGFCLYYVSCGAIFFLIALTCCATFPHLIIKTPR